MSIENREVLSSRPNFASEPEIITGRAYNNVALAPARRIKFATSKRAIHSLNHRYVLRGAQIAAFEDFFNARAGKWKEFWVPSWTGELGRANTETDNAGATTLHVDWCDYAVNFDPTHSEVGRLGHYIWILWPDGTFHVTKVTSVAASVINNYDRLNIATALPKAVTPNGQIIGFLYLVRFISDELLLAYAGPNNAAVEMGYIEHVESVPDADVGQPFTPSQLAGLLIWLRADRIVGPPAQDAPVSQWDDISGKGNHFNDGGLGATRDPLFKRNAVNGLPALWFKQHAEDWSTLQLIAYQQGTPTAGECFFVLKADADPSAFGALCEFGAASLPDLWPSTDGNVYMGWGRGTRPSIGNPTPSLASWRLLNVHSATNDWKVFLDGTQIDSSGTNTPAFLPSGVLSPGTGFGGQIAEYIQFDRGLTQSERDQIEAYIATKYALTIA